MDGTITNKIDYFLFVLFLRCCSKVNVIVINADDFLRAFASVNLDQNDSSQVN